MPRASETKLWTARTALWATCGLVLTLGAAIGGACGPRRDGRPAAQGDGGAADPAVDVRLGEALQAADRREMVQWAPTAAPGKAFEALLHRRSRRAESVERLGRLLSDSDSGVRRSAAFALGAFEREPAAELRLIGRTVAEGDAATLGVLLEALGRVTVDAGVGALADGLDSADPAVQAGACAGWARRSLRGIDPPPAAIRAAAVVVAASESSRAQIPCVWFLSAVRPAALDAATAEQVDAALSAASLGESDELRRLTVRALAKRPTAAALDSVLARTADPDWRVAAEAFRGAGAHPEVRRRAAALAQAVEARVVRATQEAALPVAPERHVVAEAIRSLGAVARETAVGGSAAALLTQARAWRLAARGPAAKGAATLECAAAEVVDRARGWPSELEQCGGDLVAEPERALAALRVVGAAAKHDQGLAYLRPLLMVGDVRVREAALATLGAIPGAVATELLAAALLGAREEGVIAAGCDAVAARAAKEAIAAADRASLAGASAGALDRTVARDALESIQSCLRAAAAVGAPATSIAPLAAQHHNVAVRVAAAAALDRLGVALPPSRPAPPPNPIPRPKGALAKALVRVESDAGAFTIEVDGTLAPTTAANFLALVDKGFYDGLTFHRVVPGFVVQGGDPAGDGYGGPGFSQRCEESAVPYERGTVGMALAGRDTGGSQFFITYGREPRLDGEYTVFARVVSGMDVVDRLEVGDRMLSVRRAKSPAHSAKPRI